MHYRLYPYNFQTQTIQNKAIISPRTKIRYCFKNTTVHRQELSNVRMHYHTEISNLSNNKAVQCFRHFSGLNILEYLFLEKGILK